MKLQIRGNQMEELEDLQNTYPYAYHYVSLADTQVPWHWHEALEFNLVVEGSMKVSTVNQTQIFHKGEGFFVNASTLAAMENLEACMLDSHLFHPVLLTGHFKSVFETKYLNPVTQNRSLELLGLRGESCHQKQILSGLFRLSKMHGQPDQEFQTRNLLSEIWLELLEELKTADSSVFHAPQKNQDRILTMMAFIQENYAQKLTLEQIAASAAVSTRECLRCFQSAIHQTPTDYLIEYRVRAAKKLLETTTLSITQIALDCGFNSNSYFTKLFHRIYGMTPNACRKARQALEEQSAEGLTVVR